MWALVVFEKLTKTILAIDLMESIEVNESQYVSRPIKKSRNTQRTDQESPTAAIEENKLNVK